MKLIMRTALGLTTAFSMMLLPELASAKTKTIRYSSNVGYSASDTEGLREAKRGAKWKIRNTSFPRYFVQHSRFSSCKIKNIKLKLNRVSPITNDVNMSDYYSFRYLVTAKCR